MGSRIKGSAKIPLGITTKIESMNAKKILKNNQHTSNKHNQGVN